MKRAGLRGTWRLADDTTLVIFGPFGDGASRTFYHRLSEGDLVARMRADSQQIDWWIKRAGAPAPDYTQRLR